MYLVVSVEFTSLQLQKLGVIPFEEKLGGPTLISYQEMWANNGDIISKQYAGTAAMKVSCFSSVERCVA